MAEGLPVFNGDLDRALGDVEQPVVHAPRS